MPFACVTFVERVVDKVVGLICVCVCVYRRGEKCVQWSIGRAV